MTPGWQRRSRQGLAWLWAAPGSLLGLLVLALARVGGAEIRRHGPTLEAHGGRIASLLGILGGRARVVDAIALGHVVLARDAERLASCRRHEHVHVRQWERWGPLFLPAYFASSAWAWLRGRDPYLANAFEREARAADAAAPVNPGGPASSSASDPAR
jgi:hypothetical protein